VVFAFCPAFAVPLIIVIEVSGEWLANKFLGIPSEGSIFTEYGGAVGTYQETGIPQPYLSQFDLETLDKEIPANPLAEYEREVLVDRGSFIVYGYFPCEIL
jgi:hypothetical protein